jgi:hypothetical protein
MSAQSFTETARRLAVGALIAAPLLLSSGCSAPLRNLAAVRPDKSGCATLQQWSADKAFAHPKRPGESSAEEDGREAAVCWHREGDDVRARASLISALEQEAKHKQGAAITVKTGSFDDSLCRTLGALALSARAHGEVEIAARAEAALSSVHGRTLDLSKGDRTAVGNAGSAITMIDPDCFFCSRAEVYGAQDREHIEQFGRYAGVTYAKRDDGREQYLVDTKLLADGEESPQQLFAEAMRHRQRRITDASPALLSTRKPDDGEELSADAPLFHLTLRGIAVGDVQKEAGNTGLMVPITSENGTAWVRFPPKILQRAGRDRRFVAPPDGIEAVVRYDGRGQSSTPVYRAVIIRTEDGVAEGP